MKTTAQWWDEVSQDPEKMVDWLKDQFHGEITAAARIRGMVKQYNVTNPSHIETIKLIADDELVHASWVKKLLIDRGIKAEVLDKEERYWNSTLPEAEKMGTFSYMCAVAHLAETMRLDRIELLAKDERFKDIAEVFSRIIPDELFHAEAFKMMSNVDDIAHARKFHDIGCNAIGLVC